MVDPAAEPSSRRARAVRGARPARGLGGGACADAARGPGISCRRSNGAGGRVLALAAALLVLDAAHARGSRMASHGGSPGPHHRSTAEYQQLLSQIHVDLAPWQQSGISLEMVERAYCTNFEKTFRFQVIDGEMFIAGEFSGFMEFNRMTKLWLLDLAKHYRLPDIDLVMSTADGCPPEDAFHGNWSRCDRLSPLLTFDRLDDQLHCVRYPDHTMYAWPTAGLPSWGDVRTMMDMNQPLPYSSRYDTLLFRGAQTGNRPALAADDAFVWHPHTDFKITGWTGETEPGQYVTLPAHCLHKFLLHLPGMSYSARLKYLMYCNSTVLFAGPERKEFWYHLLEDGRNVVLLPAVNDIDKGKHVTAALEELVADPEKAERIAAAGYQLVRQLLQPDAVRRYFYELLVAYAKLQRFKPTRHPQAIPFKYSAMGPDSVYSLDSRECKHCAWDDGSHGQMGAAAVRL